MEVAQPNYDVADSQENYVQNDELTGNLGKTIVDFINTSNEVNEIKVNGTHELESGAFEFTLCHSTAVGANTIMQNNEIPQESIENLEITTITIEKSPNKLKLIDSESENDLPQPELQDSPVKITKKKCKLINESDSENDEDKVTIQKPFKLIDSESEASSIHDEDETPVKHKLIDSESEIYNSTDSPNNTPGKKKKKLKKRKDHKTSNHPPVDSEDENELNRKHRDGIQPVDEKEMTAIRSESQRTIREHMVEIPCHKPRTFTLKEFLERKTVVKPTTLIKDQNKAFKSNGNIKMNREELKVFAKKIELRKRDIRSFFKSHTAEKVVKPKIDTPTKRKSPENYKSLPVDSVLNKPLVPSTEDINKENVKEVSTLTIINTVADPEEKTKIHEKTTKLSNTKSEVRLSFNYDENSFIDLESGSVVNKKVESKAEQFMNRVLKHMNASKKKKSTDENETLKRLIDCDEEYKMDIKPRGSYIKLKKQLEERIMVEKKIKYKLQQEELNGKDDDDEEMEEYDEKLEEHEEQEENEEDEDASKLDDENQEENDVDEENEHENEELDCSQENTKSESEIDEAEAYDEVDKTKTFSRIKQFDNEDSSGNEDNPAIENQLDLLEDDKLFSQDVGDGQDVEDELLGLCSGRFDTQLPSTISLTMSSQAPTTWEDIPNISLSSVAKITTDSSEGEDDDKIGAKKGRKSRKIVLSDDEDDDEADEIVEQLDDNTKDEEEGSDGEPSVYDDEEEIIMTYDSDENDVALTVGDYEKTKKMKIQNFFENEAELSESDWNSEDEDEKGADNYDIELGDEDQFDAQKLKSELAQIHMRRMLNDDERQVQMIQDLIMPDQEDKEVRERKFRWKNLDNPLVDGQQSAYHPEPNETHSDDESEEYYRKLRFERETLLQSQSDDLDPASILIKADSQDLDKPKTSTKRISIIKTERNKSLLTSNETSFLIGSKNSPLITKFRDSFLARGEQHLSSLEQLTIERLAKCADIETAVTTEKSAKLFFVVDEEIKAKRKCDENLENIIKRKKIS